LERGTDLLQHLPLGIENHAISLDKVVQGRERELAIFGRAYCGLQLGDEAVALGGVDGRLDVHLESRPVCCGQLDATGGADVW
jgi:hypothetical protein